MVTSYMNLNRIFIMGIIAVVILSLSSPVFAHPHTGQIMVNSHTHEPHTEIIPLSGIIALEKTTILFDTPDENKLPWGFVEGKIANPVEGHPVIIQIFKDNDAVHFAQTAVENDGSYEYKFRVQNYENGNTTKYFEGNYTVKIFKVVYLASENFI